MAEISRGQSIEERRAALAEIVAARRANLGAAACGSCTKRDQCALEPIDDTCHETSNVTIDTTTPDARARAVLALRDDTVPRVQLASCPKPSPVLLPKRSQAIRILPTERPVRSHQAEKGFLERLLDGIVEAIGGAAVRASTGHR